MKSKHLSLFFALSPFFVEQKVNKTVLIKSIRKDGTLSFCVINKISLNNYFISDSCQNKSVSFENDTKHFLDIKNIYNS